MLIAQHTYSSKYESSKKHHIVASKGAFLYNSSSMAPGSAKLSKQAAGISKQHSVWASAALDGPMSLSQRLSNEPEGEESLVSVAARRCCYSEYCRLFSMWLCASSCCSVHTASNLLRLAAGCCGPDWVTHLAEQKSCDC